MRLPLLMTLALTACSGKTNDLPGTSPDVSEVPMTETPPVATPDAPTLTTTSAVTAESASAVNQAGLAMQGKLFTDSTTNDVFSPTSIEMAFGLLAAGTQGDTAAGLYTALNLDPTKANDQLAALMGAYADLGATEAVSLDVANRIWMDATLQVNDGFQAVAEHAFGAGAEVLPFGTDASGSRVRINEWVSDNTQGFIPELLQPGSIDGGTRMVLTNAVYFQSDWATAFDPALTQDKPFTRDDGVVVQAPTMHSDVPLAYAQVDGAQVVVLPYQGERVEFIVALPTDQSVDEMMAAMTADSLDSWLAQTQPMPVDLDLPKFELRATYDRLPGVMSDLGAGQVFTAQADLSGISSTEDLFVDGAVHQAYLKVDETGTEAAAATAITVRATSAMPMPPPPVFHADKPFWFAIRDKATGTLLFTGRVADPTVES